MPDDLSKLFQQQIERSLGSAAWPPELPKTDVGLKLADVIGTCVLKHRAARRVELLADGAVAAFLDLPRDAWFERLDDYRLQSLRAITAILEESARRAEDRSEDAIALAHVGLALSSRLRADLYGPLRTDLKVRSYVQLATTLRRSQSNIEEARIQLENAEEELPKGSGDPLEEGRLAIAWALLENDLARTEPALAAANRAIRAYRMAGNPGRLGRALLVKAIVLAESANDPASAILWLYRAGAYLDPDDIRAVLALYHNLAHYYAGTGDVERAMHYVRRAEPLFERAARTTDRLRLLWTVARVAAGAGDLEGARELFVRVREGFVQSGRIYDAAEASLELALLYAETGNTRELLNLAVELVRIFRAKGVDREFLAALALVRRTAMAGAAATTAVEAALRLAARKRGAP